MTNFSSFCLEIRNISLFALYSMLNFAESVDIASDGVSQIAGQPINSTEQEVIGLLLAQQQVFTSSCKLEPSSVYVTQSSNPSAVAMVTDDVLQSHDADGKSLVMVRLCVTV